MDCGYTGKDEGVCEEGIDSEGGLDPEEARQDADLRKTEK